MDYKKERNKLISKKKFKKYMINNKLSNNKFNKKRRDIEIESAMNIYKERFTIYKSPKTNKQFKTVYNSGIINQNRLNEMFSYFLTKLNREKVIDMINNKDIINNKDTDIFKFIKNNYRMKNQEKALKYKLSKIADKIDKYIIKKHKIKKPKILDVGCGNGKKIKLLNTLVNSKIYGTDIKSWGPYSKNKKFDFPFKYIEDKPYKIPYKNKTFDCITLFLVLHHSDNIIKTIKECKRILKDNGILIIVEHDIWRDTDNMIINLQHLIYRHIFNEKKVKPGNYFNYIEWDILFDKCKMKRILESRVTNNISYKTKYDLQYIGIYIKK